MPKCTMMIQAINFKVMYSLDSGDTLVLLCNTGVEAKVKLYYLNYVGSSNIKIFVNPDASEAFVRLG